jgi:acetyl-CoA acetyltransferase
VLLPLLIYSALHLSQKWAALVPAVKDKAAIIQANQAQLVHQAATFEVLAFPMLIFPK